jgi:hypothetical protein
MEVLDLFAYLIRLRQLEYVEIRFIPEVLQQDFIHYIAGNTITRITEDRKPMIPRNLYNLWIEKLNTKGFDYSFDCREVSIPRIPNLFSSLK